MRSYKTPQEQKTLNQNVDEFISVVTSAVNLSDDQQELLKAKILSALKDDRDIPIPNKVLYPFI